MNRAMLVFGLISHFINPAVVTVIKDGVEEAATHGEWSNGAKTRFVQAKARAAAAASSNSYDDFLVEIAITSYNAIRKGKK